MTPDERSEFLRQSIESLGRQIDELNDAIARRVAVSNENATVIRTLMRLVYPEETSGTGA